MILSCLIIYFILGGPSLDLGIYFHLINIYNKIL